MRVSGEVIDCGRARDQAQGTKMHVWALWHSLAVTVRLSLHQRSSTGSCCKHTKSDGTTIQGEVFMASSSSSNAIDFAMLWTGQQTAHTEPANTRAVATPAADRNACSTSQWPAEVAPTAMTPTAEPSNNHQRCARCDHAITQCAHGPAGSAPSRTTPAA